MARLAAGGKRLLLWAVLALAGCVPLPTPERPPSPTPPAPPTPAPPPEAVPAPPALPLRALPAIAMRPTPPAPAAPKPSNLRPMPVRPIDLEMRCAAMDERHHTVQADIDIRDSEVRYLRARLTQPNGGACEFNLADFRQTKRLPGIELVGRDSSCVLRVWEQGPQVVLAYQACQRHCTPPAAFADLLPTLFDRRVGRCD
jgi:hypothetical protein